MKKVICLLVIGVLVFSLCGCGIKETEHTTDVVISLESDGVYGLVIEYSIDRTRLGGQMISADPEMTKTLPKEEYTVKFSEQGFEEPYTLDSGKFGILVCVVLEADEEINVEYLLEWNAVYDEEYHFTLRGDRDDGFILTPTDDKEYTITQRDALPSEFLK